MRGTNSRTQESGRPGSNRDVQLGQLSGPLWGKCAWWPLLSPLPELPRLTYPGQMLYLFMLLIPMAAVSAPIALAPTVIYPWYAAEPHPLGLTPLADQELGGLLMWVGAGLYLMCVFSLIFFRWARREDRDEPVAGRPAARPSWG